MFELSTFKKILAILTSAERRQLISILMMMVIGMFFELFGIAIVVPFISIVIQDDYVTKVPEVTLLLESLGNPSHLSIVMSSLSLIVIIFAMKNLFLMFLAWRQSLFSTKTMANLSNRLFDLYLHQPYTFHLQNNSAQLIRNTINEVQAFGIYGLNASLLLVSEISVLVGILILLLCFEPVGTISAILMMGIMGGIFHFFSKDKIFQWGEARQIHDGMKVKHIQQGLGGSKIVKLQGREKYFIEQYRFHAYASADVGQKQLLIGQIPRFLFEIMAILALAILISVLIYKDNTTENIMPILGLFALAAFRLMPSVNRIMLALQNLKYGTPIVDLLFKEVTLLKKVENDEDDNELAFKQELELKEVNFSYPNTNRKSINNISLCIKKGETIGFVGESGAGKSTIADIILGLLNPLSGQVLVDGVDIQNKMRSWQTQIGYVPQSIYLTDDTLRRNIAFGLKDDEIDDEKVWSVLKMAQLDDFIKNSTDGLETLVGERGVLLSGGQQQRIGIARALYHNPSVLLLDEATSALDNETEARFMETIEKLHSSKTIIIIAHRLSTVQNCNRVYTLKNGCLINDSISKEVL